MSFCYLHWASDSSRMCRWSSGSMWSRRDTPTSCLDTRLSGREGRDAWLELVSMNGLFSVLTLHTFYCLPSLGTAEIFFITDTFVAPDLQTPCSRSHIVLLGQQWRWSLQHMACTGSQDQTKCKLETEEKKASGSHSVGAFVSCQP